MLAFKESQVTLASQVAQDLWASLDLGEILALEEFLG